MFIANRILERSDEDIRKQLFAGLKVYYLGSVFPDIFSYSKKTSELADKIHGKSGENTADVIFQMLDNDVSMAFIFGYITHCAADMIFHPVVWYLSGNYYDKNKIKMHKARYRHYYVETYIDTVLNDTYSVDRMLYSKMVAGLGISDYFTDEKTMRHLLSRVIILNRIFKSRLAHKFALLLWMHPQFKALFYSQQSMAPFEHEFEFKDISGKKHTITIQDLLAETIKKGVKMIAAADKYKKKKISKKQCAKILAGESLETGRNAGIEKFKYASQYFV